jgi:CRP/FNR family transcriptional regulator, polysaccharide utilization system transcription regulator
MKSILLIEDNKDVRENIAEILELAHYEVRQAENGKLGVELAQQQRPDLIICDIMMPVLDGYGVIHLLSKNAETASIPFIFLTAKSERSDFRKGMELGADDYITKPFDDVELLRAVESRLKRNEMLRAEFSKNMEGLNKFFDQIKEIDELKKLSSERRIKVYKKKEIIFNEGNSPNYLYFLSKGKIKTFKSHEYGKELITNLYKEGDFFGYLALLEDSSYADTAEALEDSEVCLIPKEDFFALIYNNLAVMKKFIRILSDNISEKEEQLVNLAYSSVRKRVAEALILLQNLYDTKKDKSFSISISREDLANIVGTATESLIRTLSDFKAEKLVEIKGSNITIVDAERLKKLRA